MGAHQARHRRPRRLRLPLPFVTFAAHLSFLQSHVLASADIVFHQAQGLFGALIVQPDVIRNFRIPEANYQVRSPFHSLTDFSR